MRKLAIFGLMTMLVFSLSACGKNDDVDLGNLNDGVNNLLGSLPDDEINIEVDINQGNLTYDEYDDSGNSSTLTEEDLANLEAIKKAEEFANAVVRTSEDAIPKGLNFSFYDYSSNVPSEFEYHGCLFAVEKTKIINTSISMFNPSIFLTTGLPFYNDTQKSDLNEMYQNLMKGIVSDYGEIAGGENYSVFDIMDIDENFYSGMVFDYSDCYVLVRSYLIENPDQKDENGDTAKMVMVGIGYISKHELHEYEGSEYTALKYIEKYVPGASFKYYYYDENGNGYTLDKDSISVENIFMMY